jgi:hypothetical protein
MILVRIAEWICMELTCAVSYEDEINEDKRKIAARRLRGVGEREFTPEAMDMVQEIEQATISISRQY